MFLAIFFNLLVGLGLSICGRERIRIDGLWGRPAFPILFVFATVLLIPLALYLYLAHPAWTWMYALDPSDIPSLLFLPLLVGHGVAVIAGWVIGGRLIRAGNFRHALIGLVMGSLVLAVAVLGLWGRLGRAGTLEEFRDGRALGLFEVKLGYVLVVMVLGVGAAITIVALQLVRDSRRATSR